ncbi:hypothetical protein NQ176_g7435 [Zarea fungicola]|uniref:Uncharacterized protein n=1 Tax=Zarea fungicola TaxID=93591 RepID=A0ACC1N0H5_9HYPO|nr:hypothetical protein NQ176_g7435 [Lecanicillium fungicola]
MLPPGASITHPIPPPLPDSYIVTPPKSAALCPSLLRCSPPMPAPGYDTASVSLDGLNIIQLPIEGQSAHLLSIDHLNSPANSSISISTSSSRSSLSRRRSVSSMTGLMPLTLSASASNFSSPILSEESMEQRVADCLPELLARDLELAREVFASRSMTAGAPSYSVVADYMARAKAAGQFTNRLSMASPYHPASARVRVLGSIEEKDSMASFLEQPEHEIKNHNSYPDTSDIDSLSSAGESSGIPPPFRYHRNTSIVTAATSVTASVRRPSPKPTPPPPAPTLSSWIDGDSDEDSDGEEEPLDAAHEPVSPLSPRPPTPPTAVDKNLFPQNYEQSMANFRTRILHKKSHSATGIPSIKSPLASPLPSHRALRMAPSKRSSAETTGSSPGYEEDCIRITVRTLSSEKPKLTISPPPIPPRQHERLVRLSAETLQEQTRTEPTVRRHAHLMESPPPSEGYPSAEDIEDDSLYGDYMRRSWQDQSNDLARPTPPASPQRNFVTLAHSAKPYVPNFLGEELARVVPLPPDVIETLPSRSIRSGPTQRR